MQALQDIFDLWPTLAEMARSTGRKYDRVRKWQKAKRIPEDSWQAVIDAALVKGRVLTAADLLAANAPPKLRGRPAHKIRHLRRRKRSEERIGS